MLRVQRITIRRIISAKNNIKKKRWRYKERVKLAIRLLGDIIPMVSGRNFRVQTITGDELYRRYCEQVGKVGDKGKKTDQPLSITKINNILAGCNIHHSKDTTQCPTCRLLADYDNNQPPPDLEGKALIKWQRKLNKAKKSNHKHIAQTQHKSHKQTKQHTIH